MAADDEHGSAEPMEPPATPMKAPPGAKTASPKTASVKKTPQQKAKAKAKAKTKPKGEAKASPGKSMKVLKKPSKPTGSTAPKPKTPKEPKDSNGPLKKPSSKTGKGSSLAWASGVPVEEKETEIPQETQEDGEEEDPVVDMEVDHTHHGKFGQSDSTKDRSKDQKFKLLLASKSLPDWVLKAWDKTLSMKTGRQAEQRKLVNSILDRTPGGKLLVNLDKPELQQMKEEITTHSSMTMDRALSKVLLKGKFGLTEDDFQQALVDGDIQEVITQSGKVKYSWNEDQQATVQASSSKTSVSAKAKLTEKEAQVQEAIHSSWQKGLFQLTSGAKALALKDQPGPLALCDADKEMPEEIWQHAQGQLKAAMGCLDKLDKDTKKALQSIGVDSKEDTLYPTLILDWYQDILVYLCGLVDTLSILTLLYL